MNELQEELDAINFAEADELSLVVGVGWRTFLKCIPSLWLLALVCSIPPACIIANIPFEAIFERLHLSELKALKLQMRIESLVELPFLAVVFLTTMVTSVRAMAGRRLGALADFKTAMRRLPATIWTFILAFSVLIGIAFCLAILLGVLCAVTVSEDLIVIAMGIGSTVILTVMMAFFVTFIFCLHSTAIGGTCGASALRESSSLVMGRWWATLGELIVLFLVFIMLYMPVFAETFALEFFLPGGGMAVCIAKDIFTITLGFIAVMFLSSAMTVLYLLRRWRVRREACSCVGEGYENGEVGYKEGEGNE